MADTETTVEAAEGTIVSEATTAGIEQKPFIVGEHSVYNTVEDLYKGAVQKEQYIQKLLKEAAELRAQVEQNKYETDLRQELIKYRKDALMTNNDTTQVENTTTLTDDTIKEIALKAMQENMAKQQAEKNLQECKSMLGSTEDDINLALKNKATELGVTVEDLNDMAATKPQLFKRLFDIKEAPKVDFIPSSVRQVNNTPSTDGYSEYVKNATNPKYVSEMVDKAMRDPSMISGCEWK